MTVAANCLFQADRIRSIAIVHVIGYKQVQISVIVKVEKRGTGTPSAVADAGPFRYVGKRAVPIVMVENIWAEISNVNIRVAISVIIADGYPDAIGTVSFYAGLGSNVFKL